MPTGDLGAIDKQYDVAVSTAVGALDFIVVDTASDAQKCVEYLRKNQMGVATFLILEKQRHLAAAAGEKVQTPEGESGWVGEHGGQQMQGKEGGQEGRGEGFTGEESRKHVVG